MRDAFEAAIENITSHGDTDIFPFPIENHVLYDRKTEVVALLEDTFRNFNARVTADPPVNESTLVPLGYVGYRWATQIDPLWNAFLLGLVIKIGPEIERARIPVDQNIVYSYRFKIDPEKKTVFDRSISWRQFQERSSALAAQHPFVLICDISDFYGRIYHHRLENALRQAAVEPVCGRHLRDLLQVFSDTKSYGLPVGGPASRLLAEALLNTMDRLFSSQSLTFCRFADDYHFFCSSLEDAHRTLVTVTKALLVNEGLSLQKSKTRMMPTTEFLLSFDARKATEEGDVDPSEAQRFLELPLHYDPYSESAAEDYEHLRAEMQRFDIVGLLLGELRKTRMHRALSLKLIKAIKYLEAPVVNGMVISLLTNIDIIAPVFPSVMLMLREVMKTLDTTTMNFVSQKLLSLIKNDSYVVSVDLNMAYAIRVLGHLKSVEAEQALSDVFIKSSSPIVRRDIIVIMARWKAFYWISDLRARFRTLSAWERRAFIIASSVLLEEGQHWRRHVGKEFSPFEREVKAWIESKATIPNWEIPA